MMSVSPPNADQSEEAERFVRRLHAEHGNALYGWAHRRLRDSRDAEEVIAETLVKAWRHYGQFDPQRGSERSWLFGIARNAAADHYRRSSRHLRAVPSDDVFEPLEEPSEMNRIAEASVVQDALMELPDHHREVIVEAYFAGRTCRQIAERLGIPTGTVKSRLYYGMRSLRAALEERGVLK
jgi:RNA polymerase sigma-70 factor (ECF subfamily)